MNYPRNRFLLAGALLWAAAVFLIDLLTPLGVAIWALYVPVILVAAPLGRSRAVLLLAAACTILTVVGFFLSPPGGSPGWGLGNRAMGVLALWLSAWAAAAIVRRSRELGEALAVVQKAVRAHEQTEAQLRELTLQLDQRVTDRARELEENQRRVAAIVETAVDGIITIDERGRIDSFHRAAEQMFGYAAPEVLGRNVNLLMPSPDHERHDFYLANYLRTGEAKIIGIGREVVAQRKDGSRFPMDLSVGEVRLGDRRLFTALVRDITERRKLEQEVAAATEQERARIGRELHDGLGQQLGGLLFLMSGLHRDLKDASSRQAEIAQQLCDELTVAMRQARNLAHELYAIRATPDGLTQALESLAERVAGAQGIACSFAGDRSLLVESQAVASHLYRIAQEAVHNALKHGRATRIDIELAHRDSVVVLSVRDNGAGLPAQAAGRGIGLRTMDQRARLLGGEFMVQSRPEGGVEVTCTVPAAIVSGIGIAEGI